jgi:O-antigen/teichoic acid export membrane protein
MASATRVAPQPALRPPALEASPRPLSMFSNSLALIAAKAATMGLGFVFWLMAARFFEPAVLGVAAAVVSALMLCTQLALLGVGSAVIAEFREHGRRPAPLLNSAFTLVAATAAVSAGLFLVLAGSVLQEVGVVASEPVYAALFVAAVLLGTLGILLDQVSMALRRADQVLVRGLAFGLLAVATLPLLATTDAASGSKAIFLPWVVAGLAGCGLGFWQICRSIPKFRPRPSVNAFLARRLGKLGLKNYALTLSERAPGLMLPVLVTELLSAEANATWYAVWMMAWVVYIIPLQVGMNLFAEVAYDPPALARSVRHGIRSSLALGSVAAVVIFAAAEPLLSLLGDTYAEEGVTPLRILVFGFIPLAFIQAYNAASRGTRRLGEAIAGGWVGGAVTVVVAVLAGVEYGLEGIAAAWVTAQGLAGAWSAWRLDHIRGPELGADELDIQQGVSAGAPRPRVNGGPGFVVGKGYAVTRAPVWGRLLAMLRAVPRPSLALLWPAPVVVAAVALWALSVGAVEPTEVGDLGLISGLPVSAFLALAILLVSFCLTLRRRELSSALMVLHVVALIFMLYGATSLVEEVPRFHVVWRHVGIEDHILQNGGVEPSLDAYFNWPGFFFLAALATEVAGLDSGLGLVAWAPVAFNLMYLPGLVAIGRAFTRDARLVWLGVWVFYLSNWVGQDYFSPQALGFLIYLGVLVVLVTWFGPRRASTALRRVARRRRERRYAARPPGSAASRGTRVALLLMCVVMIAAVVPSHQLTPFAILISLIVLVLFGGCAARGLPAVTAVLIGTWITFMAVTFLDGHLKELVDSVGRLGENVSANVPTRLAGSDEHMGVVYIRLVMTGCLWTLGLVGAIRYLRRGGNLSLALLALAPFSLIGLQPYGGEMLLRIFLFSLPFVSLFVASLLLPARGQGRAWRTTGTVLAVSAMLLGGFLFARHGNERIYLFTHDEVATVERLYEVADPGSLLVSASSYLPWRYRDYATYDYASLSTHLPPVAGSDRLPSGPALLRRVARYMAGQDSPTAYLILTRTQYSSEEVLGVESWGRIATLERAVEASPRFRRIYRNGDGEIFQLVVRGAG